MKLENVSKTYKNKIEAVKDFTLNINPEEFLVIVGPSGCGKTTLLKLIAGLEKPTTGTMDIHNAAMVFQMPNLFGHMSVLENILIGKNDEQRAKEMAEIVGITSLLEQKASTLSGGQSQKVALARAFMKECDLVLMDEPCAHLDEKSKEMIQNEILRMHRKLRRTILYVTHDQKEAMKMATRIIVMNQGEIQQIGTAKEIYCQPANEFVACFFGMNVFNHKAVRMEDIHVCENSENKAHVVSSQFQGKEYISTIEWNNHVLKMMDTEDRSGQTISITMENIQYF